MVKPDWSAVVPGVMVGTAIVLPCAVLSVVLTTDDTSPNWALLFQFIILAGFLSAGFVSGRRRSDTPMLHGTYAALGSWVIMQTFGTVRRLAAGDSVAWLAYPAVGLLAATCGVMGALAGDWVRRRRRRTHAA